MKLAVLLHGSIQNDYRVIKTIESISTVVDEIWIFHFGKNPFNGDLFDKNLKVNIVACSKRNNIYYKILAHSFFCREYFSLKKAVIQTNKKFDVIWANDLPTLFPAYRLKKKFNAKLIYDAHEIYTETINQFFPRSAKGIKRVIFDSLILFMRTHGKYVERKLIKKVNQFITVNQSLLDYFKKEYGIQTGEVIMNLPRLSDSENQPSPYNFRLLYNWTAEQRILLYQGALNEGRGLKLLIDVVELLPKKYCLVILGEGLLKRELQRIVEQKQLESRIQFMDAVSLSKLPSYTKGADIGINLLEDFNLSKKLASPNKLFEYIHSGIPVLGTATIENVRVVERFKIGEICDNNVKSITEGIYKIELNNYSEELNAAKEYYNWESHEAELFNLFNA